MNRSTSLIFSLLLITGLSLLSGCSSSRRAGKVAKEEMSSDYLLKRLAKQRLQPDWFGARANIDYNDESMSFSATATIRMRRDSLLWMSIKKLGFELARVQVTRDSVYVIDRINNEYAIEGLDYLARSYGLPASLNLLQDFILGNPVFFSSKGLQLQAMGPSYHLSGQGTAMESDYWIDANSFILRKMAFNDKENQQQLSVLLEEYGQSPDNQNFSYLRNLEMESPYSGKTRMALKFSKLETEAPKSIRFEIPDRYSRAK